MKVKNCKVISYFIHLKNAVHVMQKTNKCVNALTHDVPVKEL